MVTDILKLIKEKTHFIAFNSALVLAKYGQVAGKLEFYDYCGSW